MSSSLELSKYKKNKINKLKKTFNYNVSVLKYALRKNANTIINSRINTALKKQKIKVLINNYNTNLKTLKNKLNADILLVNNFVPKDVTITGKKSALLIGINYTGTQNQLNGCINDVNSIKERIQNNGFNNINILTDNTPEKPTKSNILHAFAKLLNDAQEGDFLFFCYSGHGTNIRDKNRDETDGYDELIVPLDLKPIVDDLLKAIIQKYLKPNVTLFAMFDSCFSGTVLDLKYQYMDSLNYDNYTENSKQLETLGNVFMISGCNDKQFSSDSIFNGKANGAMTWSLLKYLKQKPNCSWRELVKGMRDLLRTSGYEQIPQFSCGKFEDIDSMNFI
jgi:hypothetical protein